MLSGRPKAGNIGFCVAFPYKLRQKINILVVLKWNIKDPFDNFFSSLF